MRMITRLLSLREDYFQYAHMEAHSVEVSVR